MLVNTLNVLLNYLIYMNSLTSWFVLDALQLETQFDYYQTQDSIEIDTFAYCGNFI